MHCRLRDSLGLGHVDDAGVIVVRCCSCVCIRTCSSVVYCVWWLQVVLRGGLVAPWDAVPPLVAQLTDELPETRTAALKVSNACAAAALP